MPANYAPPWNFQGPFGSQYGWPVGPPLEWFIHVVTIQRMPQGTAGADDAGGRISAVQAGYQVMIKDMPALVLDMTTEERGPEQERVRLVQERRYDIYTPTDLTGLCRPGDVVAYDGRFLNVTALENVKEQFILWKIHATEYQPS